MNKIKIGVRKLVDMDTEQPTMELLSENGKMFAILEDDDDCFIGNVKVFCPRTSNEVFVDNEKEAAKFLK